MEIEWVVHIDCSQFFRLVEPCLSQSTFNLEEPKNEYGPFFECFQAVACTYTSLAYKIIPRTRFFTKPPVSTTAAHRARISKRTKVRIHPSFLSRMMYFRHVLSQVRQPSYGNELCHLASTKTTRTEAHIAAREFTRDGWRTWR